MAESNYIPNSQKYKDEHKDAEEHRAKKVVTGEVKQKKKGAFSKFLEIFLPEDVTDTKHYITYDVIVPEIKKTVLDIITGMMYGSRGIPSSGSRRVDQVSYRTNYQKYGSNTSKSNSKSAEVGRSYDPRSYEPPLYANRGDAEVVLSHMLDIVDEFGFVSILDMLDLAGITVDYTYAKYGWYDLRDARVIPVSGGYEIELPKAVPID